MNLREIIRETVKPFICEHQSCSDNANKQYPDCEMYDQFKCPINGVLIEQFARKLESKFIEKDWAKDEPCKLCGNAYLAQHKIKICASCTFLLMNREKDGAETQLSGRESVENPICLNCSRLEHNGGTCAPNTNSFVTQCGGYCEKELPQEQPKRDVKHGVHRCKGCRQMVEDGKDYCEKCTGKQPEEKPCGCYICGAEKTCECHSLWYDGKTRKICGLACRSELIDLCLKNPDKTYSSKAKEQEEKPCGEGGK